MILRGRTDLFVDGKISQEAVYFLLSHFVRMTFVIEQDEFFNPVDITLFCTVAVMFNPNGPS